MDGHLPGGMEGACLTLEEQGAMPRLVKETREMYARPDRMFREVWHGSGRQLIPEFSEEARIEYIQLCEALIEKYEYMEDMDLHYTIVSLGSVGILGAKQLAEIVGVTRKNIQRGLYRPQTAWEPRLGGDFNRAGLRPVKESLKLVTQGLEHDFEKLYEAKEAGISVTLLSRLAGIPAQTLSKRFKTIAKRLKESTKQDDYLGAGVPAFPHLEGHPVSSSEEVPVTSDSSETETESQPWPQCLATRDITRELAKIHPNNTERRAERKALLRERASRAKPMGNGAAKREATAG